MLDPEVMLQAAEDVVGILNQHHIDAVVIGATALAAYRYVRQTEDVDLGVNADLVQLRARNPDIDLAEVRAVCDRYRLPGLDELIAEAVD